MPNPRKPNNLKPLDQIRLRGLDVFVLEIKKDSVTVQLDDGSKLSVPLSECLEAKHGGARPGAGRPPKLDKDRWGQITCVLRHDTIARLREGADSRFFGEFLQQHLDRFPPPSREQYLLIQKGGTRAIVRPRIRYRTRSQKPPAAWVNDPNLSFRERMAVALDRTPAVAYQKFLAQKNDRSRKTRARRALAH